MDVRTVRDELIVMHGLLLPPALLSFTETLKGLILLSWQLLREPRMKVFYKKYDILHRLCVLPGCIVSTGKNENFVSSQALKMSKI